MNKYEIIGIIGTVCILTSMCIPSTHRRQNILMRCINSVGCIVMVVYSIFAGAISSVVMNAAIFVVNLVYIIKLAVSLKNPDPSVEDED